MGDGVRAGLRAVATGIALVLVLAGCGVATVPVASRTVAESPLQRQLVADVSGEGAVAHLEALERIADANGGHRASPGPGYEASVDYVAGVLRDAGWAVETPTYPAPVRSRGEGKRTVELRQVVAQTRSGDPENVVVVGAHLDSVDDGPGINDNGTGVAALLEIATRLGGSPPVTNAVRLAFWGSEEEDLDGSVHYVGSMPAAERERMMLYVNLDMLASPNGGYFVQGGEGRRTESAGPPGSAEVGRVLTEELAATGVTAAPERFDGSSDYAAFVEAGVPSGGLLAGDEEDKSDEEAGLWGGRPDTAYDPCYHEACDRLANIDRAAFDRFTTAVAGATARFATTPGPLVAE